MFIKTANSYPGQWKQSVIHSPINAAISAELQQNLSSDIIKYFTPLILKFYQTTENLTKIDMPPRKLKGNLKQKLDTDSDDAMLSRPSKRIKRENLDPLNNSTLNDSIQENITEMEENHVKKEKIDELNDVLDENFVINFPTPADNCLECGMDYIAWDEFNKNTHEYYHNAVINALKYLGWKKERVVKRYADGRIISILPEDPKYALLKAEEVRRVVDTELGFSVKRLSFVSNLKYFLFISYEKMITGCLIAEPITQAFRVVTENPNYWFASTESQRTVCGVSRLWTLANLRRNNIATRLMDSLRSHFLFGYVLADDDIAFNSPTASGCAFATKYMKTGSFLVYR